MNPAFHACLITFCLLALVAIPAFVVYALLSAKMEEIERRMNEDDDE